MSRSGQRAMTSCVKGYCVFKIKRPERGPPASDRQIRTGSSHGNRSERPTSPFGTPSDPTAIASTRNLFQTVGPCGLRAHGGTGRIKGLYEHYRTLSGYEG